MPTSYDTKPRYRTSAKDEKLLKEIRDKFRIYSQFWRANYDEGDLDMDCISTKYGPWPADAIKEREDAKRPIVHINITKQFLNRIVNQFRLNPRGIVITPSGSDANDETAEMREDRIRQIDYESQAVQARLNAAQNAVERGMGFYMVTTKDVRPDSFNKKIDTRQIPNPKSVLVDPYAKKPDWSDMKGAFVIDRIPWDTYSTDDRYEDAAIRSFSSEFTLDGGDLWMDDKSIQICEYWCVKIKKRKFLRLAMPEGPVEVFADEIEGAKIKGDMLILPAGEAYRIERQKVAEMPTVKQYITNGFEVLEEHDWPGSTIPIVVITGYRKYEKGKLVIESATRNMRAPQLTYDYIWTNMQEVFGMVPKSHWEAAVGQIEEFPEWQDVNRSPVAVLRYRAKTPDTGESILSAPNRVDYTPRIEPYLASLQHALVAMQQAAGMFSIERQNQVQASGKAQEQQNQSQDLGNYHFSDYLDLAVQYEGRIKNEILRHIEDTDSVRGFRKEDDKYERQRVTPMADPETGEMTQHPYGKGRDHDVVVKAGPAMQSQWEKASDFLEVLAGNPQYGPMIMDLVVRMKELGPMGKKLAERFEKMLPPALQEKKEGEEGGQPQIQPEVQQMLQALTEQLNAATEKLESKQAELDAKIQMNQADNATKLTIENMKLQQHQMAQENAVFMQKMDQMLELMMQGRQLQAGSAQQGAQQEHEARQAEMQASRATTGNKKFRYDPNTDEFEEMMEMLGA